MNSHSTDRCAGSSPWSDLVLDGQLLQCVIPEVAHLSNSLRCRDHVWLLGHLHRRCQASGMRVRDPEGEVNTFTWCAASDAYSQYPSAHPEATQALCASALGGSG